MRLKERMSEGFLATSFWKLKKQWEKVEKCNHSVLEWIYEDEDNAETLYAAEKHFCAVGHSITEQTIHGWLLKHDEIYQNLDEKAHRFSG